MSKDIESIARRAYEWVRARDQQTAPAWEKLPGPDRRGFVLLVQKALEFEKSDSPHAEVV